MPINLNKVKFYPKFSINLLFKTNYPNNNLFNTSPLHGKNTDKLCRHYHKDHHPKYCTFWLAPQLLQDPILLTFSEGWQLFENHQSCSCSQLFQKHTWWSTLFLCHFWKSRRFSIFSLRTLWWNFCLCMPIHVHPDWL